MTERDPMDRGPELPAPLPMEAIIQAAMGLRAFYVSLIDAGFTEDQALALTAQWMLALMGHTKPIS